MSDDDGGNGGGGGGGAPPRAVSYTRKRTTTTKTRNAASSARRRKNRASYGASYGGGGDDDAKDGRGSWFARRAAGWTDSQIRSRLTTGEDDARGGASFEIVGDVIQGGATAAGSRKRKAKRRGGGPKFAWEGEEEEEEEEEDGRHRGGEFNAFGTARRMAAAPTLSDIMDEQDKVDFMAPLKVGEQYRTKESTMADGDDADLPLEKNKSKDGGAGKSNSRRRRIDAALAELAQVSGAAAGGNNNRADGNPSGADGSVGSRLLRACGYRSRLGLAFVPLPGHAKGGGIGIVDDDEAARRITERDADDGAKSSATREARWLASKRLRAIRLPTIQNVDPNVANKSTGRTSSSAEKKRGAARVVVLSVPPPKIDRHGIGFDPFANAPEFREFHERRRALARERGRGTDDAASSGARAEGGNTGGGRRRGGDDRYFTDDLRDGRRRPWDDGAGDGDDDGEGDDDDGDLPGRKSESQHSHHAADRNYSDLIGTRASSGFALRDEDDADVYQDGDRGGGAGGGAGEYATEIQSPSASEDEDDAAFDGGPFGRSGMAGGGRRAGGRRSNGPREEEERGKMAEAWSAWGEGGAAAKRTTADGKPLPPGFALGRGDVAERQNNDEPAKRYRGPVLPSGYVLRRHVFPAEDGNAAEAGAADGTDSGLGLDLRRRRRPPGSTVPRVLPPSSGEREQQHQERSRSDKMLARDGTELNFHAVRESMKNRFVSSAGDDAPKRDDDDAAPNAVGVLNPDEEEWVRVAVAPWVPTRLLCKRWGVPFPSTAGLSAAAGGGEGTARSREEAYFRQTIYDPAVADRQRKRSEGASGGSDGGREAATACADGGRGADDDGASEPERDDGPPPDRPSSDVFHAIFDAESDMDISSSDEDDDADQGEQERIVRCDITRTENDGIEKRVPNCNDRQPNNSTGLMPNEVTAGTNSKEDRPREQIVDDDDDSSTDLSASSRSHSSDQRRRRRRHRRSRDDADEDHYKRRRKDKRRKKHHRRRQDSAGESDEAANSFDGGDDRGRHKNKRHSRRSHSRQRRRKR